MKPAPSPLIDEDVGKKAAETVVFHRPIDPESKECESKAKSGIKICVRAAQPRDQIALRAVSGYIVMADGAHGGEHAHPVRKYDEDEDGSEEPEGFPSELGSHDTTEEALESFDNGFCEILQAAGYQRDLTGSQLGEKDNHSGHDPHRDHRVGDFEETEIHHHRRIKGQRVVSALRAESGREAEEPDGKDGGEGSHDKVACWGARSGRAKRLTDQPDSPQEIFVKNFTSLPP